MRATGEGVLVEDGFLDGLDDWVFGREGPAEVEEHLDGPVTRIGQQRAEGGQSAERESRAREHRMGEQDAEQCDVQHEPLDQHLGGGQILMLHVAGDDAGVVRAVPAAGLRCADEVHPVLDAAGAGRACGPGGQQVGLGLVPQQPFVDGAPPGTSRRV
ncbi:hypothetical protein ACFYWN_22515 [Streptomyces sp. NPDC002917]|uniref:hypothetical protein n=1 Tax=Streptomyces sp. NPDC002917 TaxID=3364671 RepID=UPI0036C8BE9A